MQKTNRPFDLALWIKENYLKIIIFFLVVYLFFAFIAPVLMKLGSPTFGKLIYRYYSNLCHQYAYRSWFLFGEQSYYPLETGGDFLSVSQVFEIQPGQHENTRAMIGNSRAGYKVAICQRDVALYSALLAFTVIFSVMKKDINKLPFLVWIILGVFPIGLDGLIQLASSYQIFSLNYESSPLMRSITGAAFGFFSGWLLLPAIEDTLKDE